MEFPFFNARFEPIHDRTKEESEMKTQKEITSIFAADTSPICLFTPFLFPLASLRSVPRPSEQKVTGKLLDLSLTSGGSALGGEGLQAWTGGGGEKIFLLNNNILAGVAGITSDANSLVNYARNAAQRHLFTYDEEIPVEMLAQRMCDLKQGYTQYGGLRPFGVSLLYIGYDSVHGFQLYHSDPSGNYSGWKATCIGANNSR